LDRFITLDSHK